MIIRSTVFAALCILAACGRPGGDLAASKPAAATAEVVPPAIIEPGEVADPAAAPSYEVAIASGAAERNKAMKRCEKQPEGIRSQCVQEANAAFAETEASLQDLRGNQP